MKYETVYAPVKVSERNPKNKGRYFVITDNEFQDGNVFLDGWVGDSELGKTTEWLEPLENRYIFTKEELKRCLERYSKSLLNAEGFVQLLEDTKI